MVQGWWSRTHEKLVKVRAKILIQVHLFPFPWWLLFCASIHSPLNTHQLPGLMWELGNPTLLILQCLPTLTCEDQLQTDWSQSQSLLMLPLPEAGERTPLENSRRNGRRKFLWSSRTWQVNATISNTSRTEQNSGSPRNKNTATCCFMKQSKGRRGLRRSTLNIWEFTKIYLNTQKKPVIEYGKLDLKIPHVSWWV